MMHRLKLTCLLALLVAFAPAPASAQWSPASCTALGKNLFVRDVLSNLYLWYAEMTWADPAAYDTPEEYLEAVRYRPLDATFSYVTSRAASEAFYGESQYVGFGFSTTTSGREMRILQVFPDSPASEAGLSRGARILTIDGRTVTELIDRGTIGDVFGPADIGVGVDLDFVNVSGDRRSARLIKRVVTIPTVSLTRVYETGGRRVGYIFFRNFVRPSFEALDAALAELATARIDDLVLDVRYNGGGLVSVAQHLASVIGGARTRGQVFAEFVHNDKNRWRNETLRFEDKASVVALDRLILITTTASASASELLINALRPFVPVVVIGDRTYGKPVGQYQIDFCDKTLAPVAFSLRNARGEGDYFNGFAPDCAAADDVQRQLGDPAEASLREALTFASTNSCSTASMVMQRLSSGRSPRRVFGWQSVLNAY
jgi:carboxyl-terminal processing protease